MRRTVRTISIAASWFVLTTTTWIAATATAWVVLSATAQADTLQRVEQLDRFTSLVKDRSLTRFGIRLNVGLDGKITGRAFGRKVTGDWTWRDGYFCRDLYLNGNELDVQNCQMVQVRGNTVRFTSDRGVGDYADLRVR